MKRLLVLVCVLLLVPDVAFASEFANIAKNTFSFGQEGAVLIQLPMIALLAWLFSYIASATGNGRIANMITSVAVFICIGYVAKTAWWAFEKVVSAIGLM